MFFNARYRVAWSDIADNSLRHVMNYGHLYTLVSINGWIWTKHTYDTHSVHMIRNAFRFDYIAVHPSCSRCGFQPLNHMEECER